MQFLLTKLLWSTLTITGLVGAIVGFILPVIPGIPFLILMIYSLKKLSPKFHQWLSQTWLANWLREHQPKLAKWLMS
ncbi:hypothetical protein FD04_GL001769 [Secundilactobacillus odoratitofui DSM 19909 = JCM 15043]|uniref:Uncharacterized protein n=1 Tax=Secundilactobacillus odoratitofui DSM 19909 = JCM 15043 TaxID=1423776 RepID=A0A0R1LM31_9LACO|nr:DUF454 family protein [Secundilactobacillus odoratitofui]KRK96917.1 hypothetical protein FD04_GL001769 [Secundilactobacillus odoratitofui DSM 19909 = JCM 15043]